MTASASQFYYYQHSVGPENSHWHNETEVIFAERGYVRLRINNGLQSFDLYKGGIAVIRSGDMHKIHPIRGNSEVSVFRIPPSGMALFTGTVMPPESYIISAETLEKNKELSAHLFSLMEFMKAEYASENENREQLLAVCSSELCMLLIRLFDQRQTGTNRDNPANESIALSVPGRALQKFEQILIYTKENVFDSKLSLSELAEKFDVNSTYISELFLRYAGIGYKKYVITLRLNKAAELLCSTDKNISEIAYSCGFDTIRTFNKIFKSTVNMTPTEFRSEVIFRTSQPYLIKGGCTENSSNVFLSNVSHTIESISQVGLPAKQYLCVQCKDTVHKIWTTVSTSAHFLAGQAYTAHFYMRAQKTKDPLRVFINFRYLENGMLRDHIKQATPIKKIADWIEYQAKYAVPKEYVPAIEDSFSVYANPDRDIGISFDITQIDLYI